MQPAYLKLTRLLSRKYFNNHLRLNTKEIHMVQNGMVIVNKEISLLWPRRIVTKRTNMKLWLNFKSFECFACNHNFLKQTHWLQMLLLLCGKFMCVGPSLKALVAINMKGISYLQLFSFYMILHHLLLMNEHGHGNTTHCECLPKKTKVIYISYIIRHFNYPTVATR